MPQSNPSPSRRTLLRSASAGALAIGLAGTGCQNDPTAARPTRKVGLPPARLAVVNQDRATITFFDAMTHRRLSVLPMPSDPHELCFDAGRRRLYCSITYRSGFYEEPGKRGHEIVVVDADTMKIERTIDIAPERSPHGMALDAEHNLLYAAVEKNGERSGGLVAIDTKTGTIAHRISSDADGTHWCAITPDGTKAYTTNKEAPFVSVLDLGSRRLVERIDVPGSEGIAAAPDGRSVFVAVPKFEFDGSNTAVRGVQVVDVTTDKVIHTIPTEHIVYAVHVTTSGTVLTGQLRLGPGKGEMPFTPLNGLLEAFDPRSFERIGRTEVEYLPLTVSSSPDGARAYAANLLSGTVTVIDLETYRTITTLRVDHKDGQAGPHGLAHIPDH